MMPHALIPIFARWQYLIMVFAFLLASALIFGSCGGDDDDDTSDPTAGTTQPAGANQSPAGGGSSPAPSATAGPSGAEVPGLASFEAADFPDDMTDGYYLGKADAPVTLTMFEDFQCPFCLRYTLGPEQLIVDEYVRDGKVRLHFQNFVILGQDSANAAFAAECAAGQDRFWDMHRELFSLQARAGQLTKEQLNVGRFDPDKLTAIAADLKLDADKFNACLEDPATQASLVAQTRAARDAGINATPSFLVNGQTIQTPRDAAGWRQLLDQAVESAD